MSHSKSSAGRGKHQKEVQSVSNTRQSGNTTEVLQPVSDKRQNRKQQEAVQINKAEQEQQAGRGRSSARWRRRFLLVTVLFFLAFAAIRSGYLCLSYPQQDVPISELFGENNSNLTSFTVDGNQLTATSNVTRILYTLPRAIPVKEVEYDISQLSRENCWSYIDRIGTTAADREAVRAASGDSAAADGKLAQPVSGDSAASDRESVQAASADSTAAVDTTENYALKDPSEGTVQSTGEMDPEPHNLGEGSVIMDLGRNYIAFDDAAPTDEITSFDMLPVTLRAVNFTYTRFIINPHAHFIFTSFRTAVFLMAAAVLLELVLFSLVLSYQKNARKKSSLPVAIILGGIQSVHAVYFCYEYLTAGWASYTMAYFLMIYICTSLFLLLVCRPDMRLVAVSGSKKTNPTHTTAVYRRELPALRILLLSVLDFACTEALYSDQFRLDKPLAFFGNVLIYALLYEILYCITPGRHARALAYILPQAIWLSVAGINHYYFQYRSQAFEYSDLTMAGTFKNVAGQYPLNLSPELFIVYLAAAAVILALAFENRQIYRKKSWKAILPGVAAVVFTLCWLPENIPYVSLWNTNTATHHNGYAFSYLSYAQKSLEKPTPTGYSAKETEALLDEYETGSGTANSTRSSTGIALSGNAASSGTDAGGTAVQDEDAAVNIIVMMNEAFSDLPQTYGFDVDNDNLPYIHSLSGSNVKKGKMMVSVFGGTTADTEYEFLTGNSLSFLNGEAVPYTQYINSDQQSLARLLKNRGYSATAFHPYLSSGYKRYKVYPLLGFDQFLASDNTDLPYTNKMRSYISDDSDVQDVIDMYENREKYGIESKTGEPFFLFNVTMQNHGGYNAQVSAVDVTVKPTDPKLSDLSELQEYLSLTKATDAAFQKLTEYFAKVPEKTIILMFGDHQPSMGEYVYEAMYPQMYEENATLEEKDKKYTVPYIMWANYDLPEGDLPVTSPNFLRSFLLQNAGLTPSAYDNFVASVREEYPAMNRLGFLDAEGNYNDVTKIDSVETLMNYKKAAYYNLFDHHHMDESLFD